MDASTQTALDIYSNRTIESVTEAVKNYVLDVQSVYSVVKVIFLDYPI
jgi:hypothetical protein